MARLNKTGIAHAQSVPWGTHLCQFYETKSDLLDVLVPFFAEGLRANDAGIWITFDPVTVDEAKAALGQAVPSLDDHLASGRMEVIPHDQWHLEAAAFNIEAVLNAWAAKLSTACERGFDGLRATGNMACLKDEPWAELRSYEQRVQAIIGDKKMLALCAYPLAQCTASEVLEIVRLHDYAIARRNGRWEGLESTPQGPAERSARERAEKLLRETDATYRALFDSVDVGITLIDRSFNIVTANRRQAELIGLSQMELVGKKCYQKYEGRSEPCPGCPGARALAEGRPTELERTGYREGGDPFAVRIKASPVNDENGRATGFVEVVEDIRDRKAQEDKIAWLATFPEENPNPVLCVRPDGTLLYGNPASARLLDEWRKSEANTLPRPWLGHASLAFASGSSQHAEWQFHDRSYALHFMPRADHQSVNIYGMEITAQKQVENTLRNEKARAQNHLDIAGAVILALDLHGNVTMVNRKGCELLEYEERELIGRNWLDTCLPESERSRVLMVFQQLAAGDVQSVEYFENLVVTRSGKERLVAWHNTTIVDEGGNPVGTLSSGEDITERRAAELALRQNEARFRNLTETSPEAILLLDLETHILWANPQTARLAGFNDVDELMAHVGGAIDLLAPEEHARARENIAKVVQLGILRDIEYTVVRRDGSHFPVQISTSVETDSDGRPMAMILVVRDIAERKLAEQRQSQSLKRLAAVNRLQGELLLSAPLTEKAKKITETAVDLVDLDFCRIWAIKPGDLCEHGCIHAAATDSRDACRQRSECLHLIASAGRCTHIDGDHRRIPLGCYKVGRIASGEECELLTNSVTTDPQVADHELAKSLDLASFAGYRLHGANGEVLGVLAAFAKHSISDEDHAFLNNLAETTSKVILDSQAEEELRENRRQAVAANRLKSEFLTNMSHEIRTPMTAILGFSDLLMSSGLPEEERCTFLEAIHRNGKTLLELINSILDLSRIEADKLVLDKSPGPLRQIIDDALSVVSLQAEEKRLTLDVVYNDPLPRVVYTDAIRLHQVLVNLLGNAVKFTERGTVRIAVRRLGEDGESIRLQFDVSDTGIGIPPEKIDELFQPFMQVDGSAARRYGGTGLGLAISKRLAKALGGDIDVVSKLGEGSTFTLTIDGGPVEPGNILQAAPPAATEVEDASESMTAALLHGRVLPTEDVSDVQALTADAMMGDRDTYRASGCDDYLSKPVDVKRPHEVLKRFLPSGDDTPIANPCVANDTIRASAFPDILPQIGLEWNEQSHSLR